MTPKQEAIKNFFTTLPENGIALRVQPQRENMRPEIHGIRPVRRGLIPAFLISPKEEQTSDAIKNERFDILYMRLQNSIYFGLIQAAEGAIKDKEIVLFVPEPVPAKTKYYADRYFLSMDQGSPVSPERIIKVIRSNPDENRNDFKIRAARQIVGYQGE